MAEIMLSSIFYLSSKDVDQLASLPLDKAMALVLDKELREAETMGFEMGPLPWEKWGPCVKIAERQISSRLVCWDTNKEDSHY